MDSRSRCEPLMSAPYKRTPARMRAAQPPPYCAYTPRASVSTIVTRQVYGTLAPETKEAFSGAAEEIGFEVRYFETKLGYSRVGK